MAARTFDMAQALQKEMVIIAGKFDGNAGSDPVATTRVGPGWSVARTGTGTYRVTLTDKYNGLLCAQATIQQDTPSGRACVIAGVNLANRTIDFQVYDLATPTAQNLATTEELNFLLILTNTSSVPVRG